MGLLFPNFQKKSEKNRRNRKNFANFLSLIPHLPTLCSVMVQKVSDQETSFGPYYTKFVNFWKFTTTQSELSERYIYWIRSMRWILKNWGIPRCLRINNFLIFREFRRALLTSKRKFSSGSRSRTTLESSGQPLQGDALHSRPAWLPHKIHKKPHSQSP